MTEKDKRQIEKENIYDPLELKKISVHTNSKPFNRKKERRKKKLQNKARTKINNKSNPFYNIII